MITTIIFDMNGVITDDEEIHEFATQEVFGRIGINLTSDIYRELCLGRTDEASFKDLLKYYKVSDQNMEKMIAAKSSKYQLLIRGNLKVYPGIISLIKKLHKKYTLALTSSSTFEEVHTVVSQLNLEKFFKIIVTSKDVIHGKPDPEPYFLTAKKINVKCENCLVLEDSENGVQSAISAGMKCIAITNTEDPIKLSKADRIIDNYAALTDAFIQNI
jgi:HAD superfamily hydrolase (TIGR01509 family)